MKKIILLLALCILASGFTFPWFKKANAISENANIEVLPLMTSPSNSENRIWVGTFQLVWNDFMDIIVKGPVKFAGTTPDTVKGLNKQDFKAEYLNENSYYKTVGKASPSMKSEIEKAIKQKFNEKSDILDSIDWSPAKGKFVVYAMLKKDFKFLEAFDKLKPEQFGKNEQKVDYFGINGDSSPKLYKNIGVLFYNSIDDFAVKLYTKSDDIVYLYRTNDDKTFDKLYFDMNLKSKLYTGKKHFDKIDKFKVPDINLYQTKSFDEVCNRHILGTDLEIAKALETIDFKMNNEGVKLKSEAIIATKLTSAGPGFAPKPRYFYLNDTFVLFLQEKEKSKPYFAIRVNDVALINKTGRK